MPRFYIQRYTLQELAAYYRCSDRTMRRWVKKINIPPMRGHFLSTEQVRTIVDILMGSKPTMNYILFGNKSSGLLTG